MKKIYYIVLMLFLSATPAQARQVLIGGSDVLVTASSTVYSCIMGYFQTAWPSTDATGQCIMPTDGTLDLLILRPSLSPGQNVTATVMLNGNATQLTATTNSATIARDSTRTVSVSAGDKVSMRIAVAAAATSRAYSWSLRFTPARPGETVLMGNTITTAPTANQYVGIAGVAIPDSTESKRTLVIPEVSGVLKKFYVLTDSAPGVGTSVIFTVFNNGVAGNNVVTISDASTSGSDTTHTDTIAAAGNTASIKATVTGSPTLSPFHWGIVYQTPTPGNFIIASSTGTGGIGTSTYYLGVGGYRSVASSPVNLVSNPFTAKALYNSMLVSPGVGKSYDFSLSVNSATSALVVNQTGASTTSNVITDVAIASDDLLSFKVVNNGAAATGTPWRVSLLGYLADPATAGNFFSGM